MFECHITIDPILDEKNKDRVDFLAKGEEFKLAKLYIMRPGVAKQSTKDTFMTGHSQVEVTLRDRMIRLVKKLQASGYTVRRYKIELILLDSRHQNDPLKLLEIPS